MVGAAGQHNTPRQRARATEARARDIGRAFADVVRNVSVARELWVTLDTEEPGVHLWLIVDPIDSNAEYDLYGLPDALFARFPQDVVWLHVLNPRQTVGDVRRALRSDAEQIPLRAS
jgi:hypothetical protein